MRAEWRLRSQLILAEKPGEVAKCMRQRCHSLQSRNIGKNRDTLIFISVINQSIIPKTCISVVILVAEEPNLAVQTLCMVQRGNKADIKTY